MQKHKKKIEQLKNLKSLQQKKSAILIAKIEKEKQLKNNEISELEHKIANLYHDKMNIKTEFYNSIKNNSYSYKDVTNTDFQAQKIDLAIENLNSQKNVFIEDLKQIEKNLIEEKQIFKGLIIKEEKYCEFAGMLKQNVR